MAEQRTSALSRRKFIALTGSSVAAASVLAACGDSASGGQGNSTAEFGKGDVGILNYALTLEQLQAAFYAELAKSKVLSGANQKVLAKFGEEEGEHISALTKEVEKLGGKPAAKPEATFSLGSESDALQVAGELENVGAAAYLGQLPKIESDSVLKTVLSIHSVEGRHAAAVNDLRGEGTTPDGAFAKPATVESVLEAMQPFMA